MRPRWTGPGLGLLGLLALPLLVAGAQNGLEIRRWTVDAGGGSAYGGAYTLSGAIGQADADGPLLGGDYRLDGGFWAGSDALLPTGPAPTTPIPTPSAATLEPTATGGASPTATAGPSPTGGASPTDVPTGTASAEPTPGASPTAGPTMATPSPVPTSPSLYLPRLALDA